MAVSDPKLGPLVRRSVHHAAALWFFGTLQFLLVMAGVQLAWTHPYSLSHNVISDLGNTACGPYPTSTSSVVCSPYHVLFNVSLLVLGALVVLGALLVASAFPPKRRTSALGLGALLVAGLGLAGVGLFPENVNGSVHVVSAAIAFVGGGLALVFLSLAMFRDTRWDGYRAYTLFSGLVSLVAIGLYAAGDYFALGRGGMERLAAAPLLLWLLLASIHLLYIPAYAPRTVPGAG